DTNASANAGEFCGAMTRVHFLQAWKQRAARWQFLQHFFHVLIEVNHGNRLCFLARKADDLELPIDVFCAQESDVRLGRAEQPAQLIKSLPDRIGLAMENGL